MSTEMQNDSDRVLQQFRLYAEELDDKHDRYERIVKISRDITIESKRIIFLLHTLDNESKRNKVLKEAHQRLKALCTKHFKNIARELLNQDPYLYLRAYTSGIQEFIEALTFYEYNENGNIKHWKNIQDLLSYNKSLLLNKDPNSDKTNETHPDDEMVITLLSPIDYILGLGDLTGEVMRKCVSSLGFGDTDACFTACKFVREMNEGFISILQSGIHKELSRKAYTLRNSVLKAEMVCYNIKVRGKESSTWGLIESANNDIVEDEGFC